MAVKRYDGSAWQTVAGLGAQGAAATSSSIATWVKTASGGETSLSGNDDNSQSLSYTVGQELVFINGTLLKRGSDYTATNGTSITGLTALAANDVATVWTVNAFSVTNAISNTLVDAKGDLIVATAADTPARLAVGSANQVLTVDSSTATGLKWATPTDTNGLTKIKTATFSNVADTGTTFDSVFTSTYNNYKVIFWNVYTATNAVDFRFQLRNGGTTQNTAYYGNYVIGVTKTDVSNAAQFTMGQLRNNSVQATTIDMTVFRNNNRLAWSYSGVERTSNYTLLGGGFSDNVASNGSDGFILSTSSGNIYGTVTVYGYEA